MPMTYDKSTLEVIQDRLSRKVAQMGVLLGNETQLKRGLLSLKEKYLEVKEEREENWNCAKGVLREINELRSVEQKCVHSLAEKAAMEALFQK